MADLDLKYNIYSVNSFTKS